MNLYIWTAENDIKIKEGRQVETFDHKNAALLGLTKLGLRIWKHRALTMGSWTNYTLRLARISTLNFPLNNWSMDYTKRKRIWWLHLKVSYIQISMSYISSLHNTLGWEINAVTDGKIYWSSGMVSFFRRCWIILRIATWLPSSLRNNNVYVRGYLADGGSARNKTAADKTDNNSHSNTVILASETQRANCETRVTQFWHQM